MEGLCTVGCFLWRFIALWGTRKYCCFLERTIRIRVLEEAHTDIGWSKANLPAWCEDMLDIFCEDSSLWVWKTMPSADDTFNLRLNLITKERLRTSIATNGKNSIPKLGFIWKKIGKKLISTDYGRYGSQYSPKKSKEG